MPNEKAVRGDGVDAGDGTRVSRSCGDDHGWGDGRPRLDEPSKPTVRALKSARILLDASLDHLDSIQDEHLRRRAFPGPEVREIRRKVVTAIAMIDEIGGEL